MKNDSLKIRVMTRQEIGIAIDWAAAEGWNPGLHDADCFYAADPNGFLIGLIGDEPVGSVSAVKYDDSFGFVGFYIVKPGYRGQGYGIQLGLAALSYLKGCNVGIDGVVAQQENYRLAGFTKAYRNIRYQGISGGDFTGDKRIIHLDSITFDNLCFYDQPFFPANRRNFLKCWIRQPQSKALGIMQNGKLAGYGVARICRTGFKIGPLFADNAEFADLLFKALIADLPEGSPVFLDAPEVNPEAIALAERYKLNMVFETARMYIGKFPELPMSRLFGITSFELG